MTMREWRIIEDFTITCVINSRPSYYLTSLPIQTWQCRGVGVGVDGRMMGG